MNISVINTTSDPSTDLNGGQKTIICVVFLVASLVGLVGHLLIFWYLTFKIKRNKYTVYIINLSVADGLLNTTTAFAFMISINDYNGTNPKFVGKKSVLLSLSVVFYAMVYTGMYLLTTISVERCISALFPLWSSIHRPQNLSIIMCCLAWALGVLQSLLQHFLCGYEIWDANTAACFSVGVIHLVLSIGICFPLMVFSSLVLLIKIKRTFQQEYPPTLYIVIIAAVFMFTLFVLPINILRFLLYCKLIAENKLLEEIVTVTEFWMIVNSAINPCIYFLVGRRGKRCTCCSIGENLKENLNRAFTVQIND